jgi:hypothetical protein
VTALLAREAPDALADLRQARRHNHRDAVHWIDALYRVYIIGLVCSSAVVLGSGLFGNELLTPEQTAEFVTYAPGWLGLGFALAVAVGMRSGARGGPLTLQAATVQYELQAPIDRGITLRGPAFKQLRFMAFTGLLVGACVGMLGVRRFDDQPIVVVTGTAIAFALALVLAVSVAMIFSGRRIGIWPANIAAILLLGWSAADIALGLHTSPASMLASVAVWGITFVPAGIVGIAVAVVAVPLALAGIGGISIDDARRRAGLVAQLRFAVTLQDIRTVVLLRRQLSQETPRTRPWIRMKRGGRVPPIWRRDWRGYFRFPVVRLARMVALAAVAGLALGLTWKGAQPAIIVAGLALYLAGYDAVEPLAQEIDRPSRWDAIPEDHGMTLIRHLPAGFVVMVLLCLVSAAAALVFTPPEVVLTLLPIAVVPVAMGALMGAALSTSMGSPDSAKLLAGFGADMMGWVLLFRLVAPPALVLLALAPLLAAGSDPAALATNRVSNYIGYAFLLSASVILYLRYQKPART